MKKSRLRPVGVEGASEGQWVLLDYQEVIIHIFHEPIRYHYNLEGLWADAPQVNLGDGESNMAAEFALP